MIMDELTEFCDAVSVAETAGSSYLLGNVIDSQVVRDLGNGQQLFLVMTVDTAIITGGAAGTISFALVSDAQAAIATDGTATVHWQSKDFVTDDAALNELNAGDVIVVLDLPMGVDYERYLGILCTITTTNTTEGAINAFLTPDKHGWKAYQDAGITHLVLSDSVA